MKGEVKFLKSEAFFRSHVLVHTHVEKAAGTSLVYGLKQIFGNAKVYDTRDLPRLDTGDPSVGVYTGHMWYGVHKVFNRLPVYVATVREPVKRTISYYNYVMGRPDHPTYPYIEGLEFSDAIRVMVDRKIGPMLNEQCKALTGSMNANFLSAATNIANNYLFVLPYHAVNNGLNEISCLFGEGGNVVFKEHNKGSSKEVYISAEDKEFILDNNIEDSKLCKWVDSQYENEGWRCKINSIREAIEFY